RELPLKCVGPPLPLRPLGGAAPTEFLLVEPASSGALPLGLRRQPLARPFAIGDRVVPGDVDDGVVHPLVDRTAGSLRVPPVRPVPPHPPRRALRLPRSVEGHIAGNGLEDD